MDRLTLPRLDDLHVHLRQDELLDLVAPLSWAGGAGRVLAMPNTTPPLTTVDACLAYRDRVVAVESRLDVQMAIYLTPELRAAEIHRARAAGVLIGKWYPCGVTTGSDAGPDGLASLWPVLEAMAEEDLVLSLHGELPSQPDAGVHVLNAEERFLPCLAEIGRRLPRLRVVLEHVSSAAAVAAVRAAGPNVAATITAHHLQLIVDDWAADRHCFCKPVAKTPADRQALRAVVAEGHPRFFLGSDSAPHPRAAKEGARGAAGVFTAPYLAQLLAETFDELGCLPRLEAFACRHGAAFYRLPPAAGSITLIRQPAMVPPAYETIVPYRHDQFLAWDLA